MHTFIVSHYLLIHHGGKTYPHFYIHCKDTYIYYRGCVVVLCTCCVRACRCCVYSVYIDSIHNFDPKWK